MDLENLSVEERLSLAIESSDVNILTQLISDRAMIVRRAVARNKATPTHLVNILAFDQVANVVYHALKNKSCTVEREIRDDTHPCVTCNVRGDRMDCGSCSRLKEYKLAS